MGSGFGKENRKNTSKKQQILDFSDSDRILLQTARNHLDLKEYKEAVATLETLLSSSRRVKEVHSALVDLKAECLLRQGLQKDAIICIETWIDRDPANPNLRIKLASAYRTSGSPAKALPIIKSLVNEFPGNLSILYNYGNTLRDSGDFDEALDIYHRCDQGGLDTVDLYLNYVSLLSSRSYNKECKHVIRSVIDRYIDNFDFATLACQTLVKLGLFNEAQEIFDKILISPGEDLPSREKRCIYYFLASQLAEGLGHLDAAELACQQALELEPNNESVLMHYGNLLQTSGEIDRACEIYDQGLRVNPLNMELHRRISVCTKYRANHPHLKELRDLLNQIDSLSSEDAKSLYFALAKAEEDLKNYSQSIEYYDRANSLMKGLISRDFDLEDWMRTAFNFLEVDRFLLKNSVSISDSEKGKGFIFIVGMPRCGSTLTENILASTPNSLDLGETVAFTETISEYFEKIYTSSALTPAMLEEIGNAYLSRVPTGYKNASLITDKNLYNWRYAGLIAQCLPGAKIIHSVRNPVDNMLSIYKAHFPLGNEYSFDTDEIFKVYQLHYQAMSYYKARHPGSIIESNYDELVTKPAEYIPSLIEKLGLDWLDIYLSPEKNKRQVKTASNIQVRSPIHAKSVSGWLKFENRFKPYADRFRELGYKV